MAEKRLTVSVAGMGQDDVAQIAGMLATKANVSIRVDKNKQQLTIKGEQEDVKNVVELAQQEVDAKQTKTGRHLERSNLNAESGGENEIVKSLFYTEVQKAAQSIGLQNNMGMLPREHNFDVNVRDGEIEVGYPPIRIFIEERNLLSADSRIIVNPRSQKLEGGLVSADVEKAAGPEVAKACQELIKANKGKPLDPGHICHTKAGKLQNVDNIIHTVSLGHQAASANTQMGCLTETVVKCLTYANDNLEAGSIAMPGIYGGNAGHPTKSVAKAIYDGIVEFSKKEPRSFLKRIYLNDKNPKMVEEWKKCFGVE